jgi:hypothetical protein
MVKKIFLATIFSIMSYESKPMLETRNEKIAAAVIGAGTVGTAIYLLKRETNDSVAARSKRLISESYELIAQCEKYFYSNSKTADDCACVLLENRLLGMKDKVFGLSSVVRSRYESYVAFWNWTDQMKELHQDFKKLSKKINENLYGFSFKKAAAFISKYQTLVENNVELFADNKALTQLLEETKYIKKDIFEMVQKGKAIQPELASRSSALDFVDKKTEIELGLILEKLFFMQTVIKYGDCILSINSEDILARSARKVVGPSSSYPIKDCVGMLRADIQHLQTMQIRFEFYVQNCTEILKNVLEEIVASREYAQERQAYERHLEEQRKVQAAEAQAAAAQAQARAARAQADAMYEQNRIQKERNCIEHERNNIEKNK